ncbi:MAG: flagellar biosynthetic protein FliQ [Pseudomonadota bacterium]
MEPLVSTIFYDAVRLCFILVTILIVPALIVGLIISIFQAATQINEQTLSFLPRLLATLATLVIAGQKISTMLIEFTVDLFTNINQYIS